jgi:hypothetical protein
VSLTEGQRIPCVCGALVDVFLADSINAARHPHLRQMILDRRLHRFACASCERTLIFETSLSYVDWNRRQYIQVAPRRDLHRAGELVAMTRALRERMFTAAPAAVRALEAEFVVRLCFGYEELREKLVAFEHGLDDLVLEVAKAELLVAEPSLRQSGVLTLYLDTVGADGTMELVVERPLTAASVAEARAGEAPQRVTVQRALYDHLAGRYPEVLARKPHIADGPHVSLLRLIDWPAADSPPAPQRRSLL